MPEPVRGRRAAGAVPVPALAPRRPPRRRRQPAHPRPAGPRPLGPRRHRRGPGRPCDRARRRRAVRAAGPHRRLPRHRRVRRRHRLADDRRALRPRSPACQPSPVIAAQPRGRARLRVRAGGRAGAARRGAAPAGALDGYPHAVAVRGRPGRPAGRPATRRRAVPGGGGRGRLDRRAPRPARPGRRTRPVGRGGQPRLTRLRKRVQAAGSRASSDRPGPASRPL